MIKYTDGYFNIHTLFRIYGSALYKAWLCAAISSALYTAYYWVFFVNQVNNILVHPYPVTAVISSFTIALSFKLTFSHNRWWEACTALHNMHAKWLDVASTMAAFHLQSQMYESVAPPAFGDHQDVNFNFVRKREKNNLSTARETLNGNESKPNNGKSKLVNFLRIKSKGTKKHHDNNNNNEMQSINNSSLSGLPFPRDYWTRSKSQVNFSISSDKSCQEKNDPPTVVPSLFLQETAHLVSLLSAVALSTLRYDAEGEEAPLTEFVPGKKWPSYNSDNDQDMRRNGYRRNKVWTTIKFMLDISRSSREILEYNAARPFHVIGGISDKEAELLRNARGSSAKVALVYLWINEFMTREHIHGSMGTVAAPIISRLMQYASDGHMYYNSARKMAYIPFPFPHVQLTTAFIFSTIFVVPLLMLAKTNVYFGFVLNFLVVSILTGLNEIAKELQNPFTNVPNDLPLNLFQAHFNEALVTIFSGFHPDAYWELKESA